jgi:GH15 family glucan-1,4-alpha-glucosidase
MVLETTWQTQTGWMTIQDLLVVDQLGHENRRADYRRAPSDLGATGVLLRIATCVSGRVEVAVNCLPVFDYGASGGKWAYQGDGYDAMTTAAPDGGVQLRLGGTIPLGVLGSRCYGRTTLTPGQSAFSTLSWGNSKAPADLDEAFDALNTTVDYWRDWLSAAQIPDHPWKPYIDRSALTLKGLSYAPSGAVMAAATTSLPETPGGARNWDYRFTWIRDSAFMLRSLYHLGFNWEAVEYWGFVIDAISGGDLSHKLELQIMYGIGGERDLAERTLDHLSGYRGARPVRIGNGAWDQQQHDVWGMILDALDVQFHHTASQIAEPVWEGLAGFVETALQHWREPDQGIWEVRGDPKHFTASKVMCWVAAQRGADLARERDADDRAQRWQAGADEIKAEILDKGVTDRGVFRQHYETDDLDASLLLLPIMGFLPADDKRVKATVLAIADELTKDGLVLRYKVTGTDTGFSGEEGTFTICSFWLVTALAMIGETDRARGLCQKLLSFAGPLQLYAEEIDTATGQHLGNFPQAFTHLALIEAVSRLIDADLEADSAPVG